MKKLILVLLATALLGSFALPIHRSVSATPQAAAARSPKVNSYAITAKPSSAPQLSKSDFSAKFADLKATYANYQDSDLEAVIEDTNRQARDQNWIERANREELSAGELEAMNDAFDRKAAATSVLLHHHLEAYRAASL